MSEAPGLVGVGAEDDVLPAADADVAGEVARVEGAAQAEGEGAEAEEGGDAEGREGRAGPSPRGVVVPGLGWYCL